MEIQEVIESAKAHTGLKSDRKLASALGISHPTLLRMRRGWGYPSDENMIRLGELAGIDHARALLLLNMWRSEGEAKKTYTDLLHRLTTACLCFIMLMSATPANAKEQRSSCYVNATSMYIMEINECI